MRRPRKAILLAAGMGIRMRPLSLDLPKPLMPLWGTASITRMIGLMRSWGVEDILVNAHHDADAIFRHMRLQRTPGVRISVSFEAELLGTGGALRHAAWFVDDSPFWIANTDIVAELAPEPLLAQFARGSPLAVLWMCPDAGPRTVRLRGGAVETFTADEAGSQDTCTFTGLHLVSPRVLRYLPPGPVSSIVRAYSDAMRTGETVRGVVIPGSRWADIGTPEAYVAAHGAMLRLHGARGRACRASARGTAAMLPRRGICLDGFVAAAENVSIARGAYLRNCVLWDGASVGSGARVDGAVIGRNAYVPPGVIVTRSAVACARLVREPAIAAALRTLGWVADDTTAMPLTERGSDRAFTRLAHRNGRSAILIVHGSEREENERYAGHARFLCKHGLPVPGVIADMPAEKALLLEDLGDATLESEARVSGFDAVAMRYADVIQSLARLHAVPRRRIAAAGLRLEPAFGPRVYQWEHKLFVRHFLERRQKLDRRTVRRVVRDLATVAGRLQGAPLVLVHRDMQSSNIMIRDDRARFIDFQGMRMGPAAYDVASLLCDPYVMMSDRMRDDLLRLYVRHAGRANGIAEFFWYAAVQRLAQALGAYARLAARQATAAFAIYIPPALRMMRTALGHLDGLPRLRALVEDLVDQSDA